MGQKIFSFLILLIVGYLVLVLYVYLNQANMLYLPSLPGMVSDATPGDAGLGYQEATLTTEDNIQLNAWYVPAHDEQGVVLFCHGNAGNISHRIGTLEILNKLGVSVLIFDYRGYGKSKGKPSEAGTYRDAEAAWQYLIQLGYNAEDITVMGRSLGAAIAAELAQRHPPKALILESTFTSVPDVAAQLYPILPIRLISRFQYNTLKRLPTIDAPLLIVHSRDDEIIPFSHGQQLFAAANSPKQFLELEGGHNDGIYVTGVDVYSEGLRKFFDMYVVK